MRNSFYILILLLCFSCKKDHLFGDKKILVGTWNWQSTEVLDFCAGYGQFIDHTPENTNSNYQLVFLKKGVIEFYLNSALINSHKIIFQQLEIQKEGIVDSHKEISFLIYLDGDSENQLRGDGTPNKFRLRGFPFAEDEDCIDYAFNYFRKE